MKRTWKVIAGAAVAASLVIAPLAAASASEEVPPTETPTVVEPAPEQVATPEPPAEGPAPEEVTQPEPAPVVEAPVVEAPAPAPAPEPQPEPQVVAPQAAPVVEAAKVQTEDKGKEDNTNHPSYWENVFSEHDASCYKDSHGSITNDGKAVTLPAFNPDWPGDHWEALIVKGGSVDYGNGPGNVVYIHPSAGTPYFAPLNSGGNVADVSHWIVCKGTTPEEEPEVPGPQPCVGVGQWYTEPDDVQPRWENEGLVFQGGTGQAVGIRVLAIGNLQGWEPVSFVNEGGTEQFFFRIVIDASVDGGKAYQSLSFPGYTTITKDSVSYQFGETIAQTAARFPNANILSIGFQTNSGAPEGYEAVLKSVAGPCITHDFVPPIQEPNCTTVDNHVTLNHDGVFSVPGEWESVEYHVPFTGTLADIGTHLDVTATETQYLGLHIDTAEGTIVFEEEPSYGGNLWSTSAWDGVEAGMGYAAFGSIEEYIAYNGDVPVTGIRLLYTHHEASTTQVESFTIGCTTYEFQDVPAQPEDKVVYGEWSAPEYDCDNEAGDEVVITRTVTTTPFVWDAEAWEWVEGPSVETTEEGTYVVTSADIEALECAVTPTPTPSDTPPAVVKPASNPGTLAVTGGGDVNPLIPTAAVLASVLGGLLIAFGVKRRRQSV